MAVKYLRIDRQCVSCQQVKLHVEENFRVIRETRKGSIYEFIKRICRQCEQAARVEWGRRNRERQNAMRKASATHEGYRDKNLRSKYGISLADYTALLAAQGGACAICKTTKNEMHKSGREIPLCVDHNHQTGAVRGLLCGSCNRGLGDFRDSTEFLSKAIEYLGANHGG